MSSRPAASAESANALWRHNRTSVILHWTLALLLTLLAALGWYMVAIEDELGSGLYFDLHKSFGAMVALLVVARVIWRLAHRPAPLPGGVPRWQGTMSRITQVLLYVLMALMPITGYLGASYSKAGVSLFGLATPRWALTDHDLAERFFGIHAMLIWVLVVLVGIHVAGALKHFLIDKDKVFQRMWFGSRR